MSSSSAAQSLANMTGSPSSLQELQSLLFRARGLHAHLSEQVEQSIGLDAADVKARYGHFPGSGDASSASASGEKVSAKKRKKHRHPEPMGEPLTAMEKRKMRLLLHSLRADADGDGGVAAAAGGGGDSGPGAGGAMGAAEGIPLSVADLRGLSRSSVALFERFVLRSADVADSDADSNVSDTMTATSEGSTSNATSSPNGADDEDDGADPEGETKNTGCQTQESSMQAAQLAQRILSGDSEESYGGLKTRRFPHRVPRPPLARGAYQGPKSKQVGSGGLSPADPVAGQTYTAIAFRPQSMKQLQMNSADASEGAENTAGWTPTFFPVEIVFSPGLSSGGGGSSSDGGGRNGDGSGGSGGGGGGASSTITGSSATNAADTEGSARLIIRRLPITRDGQRFATSRNDAQQTVVADVGCGALRSVVVGQTTRFFLRGRMVLQKKPEWAKRWVWKVPSALAVHQQQQQQPSQSSSAAAKAAADSKKVPAAVDLSTLPGMAQMADRCLSLAFVDATVLNLPAKTPDAEEDAALQAAAAKASSMMQQQQKQQGAGAAAVPLHITTAPPSFLPSAGAEIALAFPSHAEFNTFLAEAMHWCGDFAAFRYSRPLDFHSPEVLKALPANVREQWVALLDDEELTFCEEFHVSPTVYLTARRRVTASADPSKSMTSDNGLLCEEDLATICDVDYLQLSAMIRFLQARGFVRLHSLFHVRKPM